MSIKAFTYTVGSEVDGDVVQQNPSWLVVFVPFALVDTYHTLGINYQPARSVESRQIVVVRNDCVSLQVTHSKESPFGAMEGMFRGGNYNYLGTVMPGDYVMVWMHGQREKIEEIYTKVLKGEAANDFDSGLKFVGRVEAVREQLSIVNPTAGIKQLMYHITAHSFQEFSTKMYVLPLKGFGEVISTSILLRLFASWKQKLDGASSVAGAPPIQEIVRLIIELYMGTGPTPLLPNTSFGQTTPNVGFLIPAQVGALLGRQKKEPGITMLKYTDILTVMLGVQNYTTTVTSSTNNIQRFMPTLFKLSNNHYFTGKDRFCPGTNYTISDRWSDIPIWNKLLQYVNSPINELFTTLRIDLDGRIVPTLIMRQVPFNTEEYLKSLKQQTRLSETAVKEARLVTLFMSLPRWKIPSPMVLSHNLGRSNVLRVNFVAFWGASPYLQSKNDTALDPESLQALKGTIQTDQNDMIRSGVRTLVQTSPHDFNLQQSPAWSAKLADWVINSHLKINGTVETVGISEPICVGDNLEWNGIVFHIEQVLHMVQVMPGGQLTFRTSLSLSNGLDARTGQIVQYPAMDVGVRESLAASDQEKIYPGYADVADDLDRVGGEIGPDRPTLDLHRQTSKKTAGNK